MKEKNYFVIKSNNLIEAFSDMTQNECKVVAFLISKIKKNDTEFNIQTITVSEFNKLLGIRGTKSYSYMKIFEEELLKRKVKVQFINGDRLNINWFQYSKYINSDSTLELCFNNYLKEHLIELNNQYTKYLLSNICKLDSNYAIRLYEILKQYEKIGFRVITLEELKYMMGIKKGYTQYCDFKKRVLLISEKSINNNTDLNIGFEEIKKGKKVSALRFLIKTNEKIEIENQMESNEVSEEDIQEVMKEFRCRYNGNLDYVLTKNLLKMKGLDCINKCLNEFVNFVGNANEVEKVFYDFTKKYGTEKAYTKATAYHNAKPPQALNYEQREYDDDYFNSLYDNVNFIK